MTMSSSSGNSESEVNSDTDQKTTKSKNVKKRKTGSSGDKERINKKFVQAAKDGNLPLVSQILADQKSLNIEYKLNGSKSALSKAANEGHVEVVRVLLRHKADVESKTITGLTPIMLAASKGHLEIVKLLLEEGADPDAFYYTPGNSGTATTLAFCRKHHDVLDAIFDHQRKNDSSNKFVNSMRLAVEEGYDDLITILLEAGAKAEDDNGVSIVQLVANEKINRNFMKAVFEGNLPIVKQLLEDEKTINIEYQDDQVYHTLYQGSALSYAAKYGYVEVVELLLSHQADVESRYIVDDKTPIMRAVYRGHLEVVKLLLEAGADPEAVDKDGYTATTLAFNKEHHNIVDAIIDHNKKSISGIKFVKSMRFAVKAGYNELITKLVETGTSDVDYVDGEGVSLVQLAVFENNYSTLGLLLSLGATISRSHAQEVVYGQTLLMKISMVGADKAVKYLIKAGADIEKKDNNKMTSLMIAAEKGHVGVVSSLLENGAKWYGIKNKNGKDARWLARSKHHDEVYNLLMLFNPYINDNGTQPEYKQVLVNAASRGHNGVCTKILDRGMTVDAVNQERKSGLMCAAEAGHLSTVNLFLMKGADPSLLSGIGWTAYQYAREKGHFKVAAKILQFGVKDTKNLETSMQHIKELKNYLKSKNFDKDDFNDLDENLFKSGPPSLVPILDESDEDNEESEDDEDEDRKKHGRTPSILETIIKKGTTKDKEKCLEVIVLCDEKKYGDEEPEKTEQRVITKLRRNLFHPDLAYTVKYVKSLFPLTSVGFVLKTCILFISYVLMGWGFYILDVGTDIHFCLSLFSTNVTDIVTYQDGYAFHGTIDNVNLRLLAVPDSNEFVYAGIISAVHIVLSIIATMTLFIATECQFTRKSLWKLPIPFVTKTHGFYLEYQRLKHFKKKRSKKRTKKIKKMDKKIQNHSDWINLSLMIEAAFESSFQFLFQSILALPPTLGLIMKHRGSGSLDDIVTLQNFSILASFVSYAVACVSIRNLDKRNTLDMASKGVLTTRIIADSISRMAFISAFMYSKNGSFNPLLIGGCYYSIFMILLVFNVVFNKEKMNCSLHYWVGLFINSLTSILTFNSFSFDYLSKDLDKKRNRPPHGTLVMQIVYAILFLAINIGFTTGTLLYVSDWKMEVENINGFSRRAFWIMLSVGWFTFFLSGVLNFGYYQVHPSGVDCTTDNMVQKMTFYLYGSKRVMWKTNKESSTNAPANPDTVELQEVKAHS